MKFFIKFSFGLIFMNYALYHLLQDAESLENELLLQFSMADFLKFSPLKFENPSLNFADFQDLAIEKTNEKIRKLLASREKSYPTFAERLIESEKLYLAKKYYLAELSYSRTFSSLYQIQKIRKLSLVRIEKIDFLKDLVGFLGDKKEILGKETYKLIKLKILLKRISCLIRLKRFYKVFFLLNLAQKLDRFSLANQYLGDDHLKLIYPQVHRPYVEQISKKLQVDIDLIYAIMREETHFNREAKSDVGAFGIMQLMPSTARQMHRELNRKFPKLFKSKFEIDNLWNLELNMLYGTYYLSILNKRYKKQNQLVVAAYNAGPTAANRWRKCSKLKRKPFFDCVDYKETKSYLNRVLNTQKYYQQLY